MEKTNMDKKIAVVKFFYDENQREIGTRGYHFYTLKDDLENGDIVAVRTVNGLRFASFDKYIAASSYAKSFIIAKIDEEAIEETIEKEAKIQAIEDQLAARMQEVKRMEEYRAVAQTDASMKALLDQLDELK